MGAGKEGVGRAVGLGGSRGCQAAEGTPFPTAGLALRDEAAAGAGGCRSLRGWTELNSGEQATRTGSMDLRASLLSTGPNASNTSDGPDNITSAGESTWRGILPPLGWGWKMGRFHPTQAKLLGKLYFTVLGEADLQSALPGREEEMGTGTRWAEGAGAEMRAEAHSEVARDGG